MTSENITENEYVEMAKHFKEEMEKKELPPGLSAIQASWLSKDEHGNYMQSLSDDEILPDMSFLKNTKT